MTLRAKLSKYFPSIMTLWSFSSNCATTSPCCSPPAAVPPLRERPRVSRDVDMVLVWLARQHYFLDPLMSVEGWGLATYGGLGCVLGYETACRSREGCAFCITIPRVRARWRHMRGWHGSSPLQCFSLDAEVEVGMREQVLQRAGSSQRHQEWSRWFRTDRCQQANSSVHSKSICVVNIGLCLSRGKSVELRPPSSHGTLTLGSLGTQLLTK